jgi:hypothetical protein
MAAQNGAAPATDATVNQGRKDCVGTRNTSSEHPPLNQDRRLDLFAVRCRDLRDRVMAGSIPFIDAVDIAYEAAIWSGLVDDVGDDRVQAAMALAFGAVPMEARQ